MTQPSYKLQVIPSGSAGTRATLKLMSDLIKRYKKDPVIRELALRLVSKLPNKKWLREISAIQRFVKNNIRYTRDIHGVETIQSPIQTLRLRAGDCDDHAILVAALLESIGHPTRIKAVGFMPGSYCHVLTESKVAGKWVSVETTEPVKLGWLPKGIKSSMIRHNK